MCIKSYYLEKYSSYSTLLKKKTFTLNENISKTEN